jgi:hypothetical protein
MQLSKMLRWKGVTSEFVMYEKDMNLFERIRKFRRCYQFEQIDIPVDIRKKDFK